MTSYWGKGQLSPPPPTNWNRALMIPPPPCVCVYPFTFYWGSWGPNRVFFFSNLTWNLLNKGVIKPSPLLAHTCPIPIGINTALLSPYLQDICSMQLSMILNRRELITWWTQKIKTELHLPPFPSTLFKYYISNLGGGWGLQINAYYAYLGGWGWGVWNQENLLI